MDFEEILASCLDALERGETIESCLNRHPQYATELAPLLRLAITVRSAPQPRLSAAAFNRGRAALLAQACYQHALHKPFAAARPQPRQSQAPVPTHLAAPSLPPRQPRVLKPFVLIHRTMSAFVALLLLLCVLTLRREIRTSLPGAALYPIKILSENMQGVLLSAAGEQIAWQARQTEYRLQEAVTLAQQGQTINAALIETIDANVLATLAASKTMPATQRNQFLMAWVDRLQMIKQGQTMPASVTLALDSALATVEMATQVTAAPVTSPKTMAPTRQRIVSATPILVPTHTPAQATPLLVEAAPAQVGGTPTLPAPVLNNPTTSLPSSIPDTPTAFSPTPTAFATAIIVQIPQEPAASDGEHKDKHKQTDSQAEPTSEPLAAAASTETASAVENSASRANASASSAVTTSVNTAPDVIMTATAAPPQETTLATATDVPPETDGSASVTPVPPSSQTGTPTALATPWVANTATLSPNPATPVATAKATTTPTRRVTPTKTPKSPTPEPEDTIEPTASPTVAVRPTDSPVPSATPAPTQATEPVGITPEVQSTPSATDTPSDPTHKQHGGK